MLSYLVGRGVLSTERLRTRARGRWVQRMTRVQDWCSEHAWGPAAVTFLSAFAGLPPYALVAVLARSLRMPWWLFAAASVVGRFPRVWAVVSIPHLLPGTLFGI